MSKDRKLRRGIVRAEDSTFVGARVPLFVVEALDRAVAVLVTDRSKFLRMALQEKIARTSQSAGKGAR